MAVIDMEQVRAFAVASGDFNPIHTSVDAAQAAGLAGPVLHGMIVAGRFETFLERLEGYEIVELRVRFVRPVPVDSALTISARPLAASGQGLHLRLLATGGGSGLVAIAEARLEPLSEPTE
jgi:acyl dehydratase